MIYLISLVIPICLQVILAQSLNLISGKAKMVSLTHAGFFGIGAYATAILSNNGHSQLWLTFPIAAILSGLIGLLVSRPAARLTGDYFVIYTLGLQVLFNACMSDLIGITGGEKGISGIPPAKLFGWEFSNSLSMLILSAIIMCACWLWISSVLKSPYGKKLTAVGEDEIYAQSIGLNVPFIKTSAFALSACIAAIPGVLYAHYKMVISPADFTIRNSIGILTIVIAGGEGNLTGIFITTILLSLLPIGLSFLGFSADFAANAQQILYGVVLIFLMLKRRTRDKA